MYAHQRLTFLYEIVFSEKGNNANINESFSFTCLITWASDNTLHKENARKNEVITEEIFVDI